MSETENEAVPADLWDRENGYVRIKLDDQQGRIKHAVQHGSFGTRISRSDAEAITRAVVAALREAAEQ
jgi:hypothetical protein